MVLFKTVKYNTTGVLFVEIVFNNIYHIATFRRHFAHEYPQMSLVSSKLQCKLDSSACVCCVSRYLCCVFICLCCVLQVYVGIFDCLLCFSYLLCDLHICIVLHIFIMFCISVLCFVCLCSVLYLWATVGY